MGSTGKSLDKCLAAILNKFGRIRSESSLSAEGEGANLFRDLQSAIESTDPFRDRAHLDCDWSIGKGNWSAVPWIRVYDRRYANKKKGLLCAYLFREDMTGVYLVIMQSVYRFSNRRGLQVLQDRANKIGSGYKSDFPAGFKPASDSDIDLRSTKLLPEAYEAAIVIGKYYDHGGLPDTASCHDDLENLLECYEQLAKHSSPTSIQSARGK